LLLLAGCEANTAPAGKTERPVGVQRITFESQDGARDFVGVVRARYENDLGFRVAGKIVTRVVNVGDRVHAGDVVARLDPQDLKLQVESAEAELAAATSNLAQAAADLERYTTLRGRGYASVADFDRKKAANDGAEGRLERARRALDLARNQHGYADLRADADGVITATLAEPGQVVAVGQAVARLAHHGEKEAVVALPETWLADARKSRAVVRLWSDRDRAFVAFGMTATVTLSHAADTKVARVPLSAILNRGAGPSVYVVDPSGALVVRPVTVASFGEDAAIVTSGVDEGDKVVTLGVQKLESGLKVRTVEIR
jgi:multidrug efflux pump subunit AcrA (membrane-fusion protein)